MSAPPPSPGGPEIDVLDPWQRDVVGKAMQLRWPVRDQADLRRVGEILRDLGNRLIVLSQAKNGPPGNAREFSALLQALGERKAAQGRLQSRPKRR